MTAHTLFGQSVTGRGAVTADTAAYTLGVQFAVSSPVSLTGIWFYSGSGAAILPTQCVIFNADTQAQVASTLNSSATWSGAAGSGWVKCTYDGSVTLAAGVHYVAAAYSPGGSNWYSDADGAQNYWTSGAGASGITSGPLSAPNSAGALNGQAIFNAGAGVTFPATTFSGFDFGVDAEVSDIANAPYSVPLLIPPGYQAPAAFWPFQARPASGNPPLTVAFASTSGGIDTYNVTSPLNNTGNAGTQQMRVLAPVSPNNAYPHSFVFMLPVDPNQGSTFGDPLAVAQSLNAHNQYNVTFVQPGYVLGPWYADNPLDPSTSQETFTLAIVAWTAANLAVTGSEQNYLIGFSRSGLGGQGLQFRHPGLFTATASWDAPFMMTDYDGTDPSFGTVGGGSAAAYGTSANFVGSYELSTANLNRWYPAFTARNRIWIAGYQVFQQDVIDYAARLSSAGITYTFGPMIADTHAWDAGWVSEALNWLFPAAAPQVPVVPPGFISPAAFTQFYAAPASPALPAVSDADTGAGSDTAAVSAAVADGDTASGADAASVAVAVSGADAAAGADTGSIAVAVSGADTGTADDAGSVSVIAAPSSPPPPLIPPGFASPMAFAALRPAPPVTRVAARKGTVAVTGAPAATVAIINVINGTVVIGNAS